MKNVIKLSILAAIAACGLSACGQQPGGYQEKRSEEEIIAELSTEALNDLGVAYAKFANEGLAYGNNELILSVNKKVWEDDKVGLDFTISYTVSQFDPTEVFIKEFVKLNDTKDKVVADLVVASDLENCPTSKALGGAAYKLNAQMTFKGYGEGFVAPSGLKITDNFVGKVVNNKSWNAVDKITKSGTITEVKESAVDGDTVLFYGRICGWFNPACDDGDEGAFRGLWVGDGNDAVMLYAGSITKDAKGDDDKIKFAMGDVVMVYGVVSPYNGLFEVKPNKLVAVTDESIISSIAPVTYNEYTGDAFNKLQTKDTGKLSILRNCTLKSDLSKKTPGSHIEAKVVAEDGTEVSLYMNYHYINQTAALDFLKALSANQKFDMYGTVSAYNGIQFNLNVLPDNQAPFVLA